MQSGPVYNDTGVPPIDTQAAHHSMPGKYHGDPCQGATIPYRADDRWHTAGGAKTPNWLTLQQNNLVSQQLMSQHCISLAALCALRLAALQMKAVKHQLPHTDKINTGR